MKNNEQGWYNNWYEEALEKLKTKEGKRRIRIYLEIRDKVGAWRNLIGD